MSTSAIIWDTSIGSICFHSKDNRSILGGLLFADKYIQIATLLPSDVIYGFGENIHQQLKVNNSCYLFLNKISIISA
jgi:hypothetical protein